MQDVPLGPKRVKLSAINDYKCNVQYKVNNQQEGIQNNNKRGETLKEEKKWNTKMKQTTLS